MRILVYYPYIPYPLDRGTYQRAFHLLTELAKDHEVDLLALTEGGERMEHRPVFEKICRRVEFVPFTHPEWPKLSERLFDAVPSSVKHWDAPKANAVLDEMIATGNYDLVHVCDIVLAQPFLDRHKKIPLSLDRTRVDLQFQLQQHATTARGVKSKLLNYESMAKMALFEKRMAKRVTMEVVCGPDDEVFIRSHISKKVPVLVVGNGVDLNYFSPDSAPDERAADPTVVFCGAMDYTPNVDALRWFFESIHDKLLEKQPDLKVLIVGRNAVPEVQAYASRTGVTVTGGVPDVRPYYRRAWAQIVPLRIGGGTRLKIVESLAMGTPVVSTTMGAQGLDLRHGQDILLADTADAFVAETYKILNDARLRLEIAISGVKVAHERFSWPSMGRILSRHIDHLFADESKSQDTPSGDSSSSGKSETPTLPENKSKAAWKAPMAILGVPFDNVTTAQTLEVIDAMVASGKPHYLATANVDFAVQAMKDIELRRILMDAHLVLCDGMPLVWASRLLGNPLPERVAGSDLVPALLKVAEEKGHRIFFLGGGEEVAAQALKNIMAMHPNLQVAGVYSPPFKPLLEMDHDDICQRVREAKTDILLVSFGCPKQEKWISMNYRNMGVPVSIGVGATIDFLAGSVKRAPRWMQKCGMEWLFRLLQEPRRLFKRYAMDMFYFSGAIVKQLWRMREQDDEAHFPSYDNSEPFSGILKLPERFDAPQVSQDQPMWKDLMENPRPIVMDGSDVTFIDSTGVGMLIRLQKSLRHAGHSLVLAAPSIPLLGVLKLMRLDTMFQHSTTVAEACLLRPRHKILPPSESRLRHNAGVVRLSWQDELTAANIEDVWEPTASTIARASRTNHTSLAVDLSQLGFMDSAGVGLMIRTQKKCLVEGIDVKFVNPTPTVRNVIKILKMEQHFFGAS